VDGKISYISRNNGSGKSELSFVYDAMGNRVEKTVNSDAGAWTETEYYVRDAQGNVMAIYRKHMKSGSMNYTLTEQHLYGSARLGVDKRRLDMIAAESAQDNISLAPKRGQKHYELSNHLGNVLATVSDKKIAVMSGANLSYYRADVVSYSDYYPFGAPMTERTAVVTPTDVRYGFQGQEEDDELWNGAVSFKYRVEDPRLGRFFSVDPLYGDFPWNSVYAFSENKLIAWAELEGRECFYAANGSFLGSVGTSSQVMVVNDNVIALKGGIENVSRNLGEIHNSLTNPLVQGQHREAGTLHQAWYTSNSFDTGFNKASFDLIAGVLYAEADATSGQAIEEVAGIFSVLENRAKYERNSVLDQISVSKGVYGIREKDKIQLADKVGMSEKKKAVYAGLIKGIMSETDFSKGAFYWDGKDFYEHSKPNGGFRERYAPGFKFSSADHDLYNQGDNATGGESNGVSWTFKYVSTHAAGKTTFSKLTNEWRDAQFPGSVKGKEVGNGPEK
jgi:RHS repeat-associated protein